MFGLAARCRASKQNACQDISAQPIILFFAVASPPLATELAGRRLTVKMAMARRISFLVALVTVLSATIVVDGFIVRTPTLPYPPIPSSTALDGIPKMFRWLTDQYPDILNRQLADQGLREDLEPDNFYLDMNGIIHPATHGNAEEIIVLDETAMFKKIFLYVDRYVNGGWLSATQYSLLRD